MATLAGLALGLPAGCAGSGDAGDRGPSPVSAEGGDLDLQAIYRATVGAELPAEGPSCEDVLSDPAAGMDRVAPLVSNDEARLYQLVFVPGLFAQCLDPLIRLFDDAMAHLAALDFEVHYFQVGGRATAEANAAMLAGQFTALQLDPKPTLVFAYSKAIVDLTDDPSRRDRARQLPACYVHADHLAIALPLRQQLPGWLLVYRDEVPRATLIEAAVRVVAAALAGHVARAPGVVPIRATS